MNQYYLCLFLILFTLNLTSRKPWEPGINILKGNVRCEIPALRKKSQNGLDTLKVNGKKIIDNYISAIGGRNVINKIMDRTTYITGRVRNTDIQIVVYQKIPNKYYQKTELGAAEQKIIFDGETGVLITEDGTQEIRGLDLEKLKYEATMQLPLYLNAYNVKAVLNGFEKVRGINAFKVVLKFPGNMEWIQYYDSTTYLKIKEIKPVSSPQGKAVNQETFFSDYREVDGVKYPFTIKQFLGTSKFEFYVDSIKVNTGLSDRNFDIE
jgi:zinc protease